MGWPQITTEEALHRLKSGVSAVDVRSEGEFSRGQVPSFVNVPILNNDHRHQVGLKYKTEGKHAAIVLGLQLVEPEKEKLTKAWSDIFSAQPNSSDRLLICWRGGLRSQYASDFLNELGIGGMRVAGGYKSLRRTLLLELLRDFPVLLVGGMTGVGKTELLSRINPQHVLDLEELANHRGSAFGLKINSPQPAQQTFENGIALSLFANEGPFVIEAESRMIGACCVPEPVKAKMDRAPMILLRDSLESRVERIFKEYVFVPLQTRPKLQVEMWLEEGIRRISPRLGGVRAKMALELLRADKHRSWIEILLREYYDPRYVRSLQQNQRQVVFEGEYDGARTFIADYLDRWRTQSHSGSAPLDVEPTSGR